MSRPTERLDQRLARLEQERQDADRLYNERLTAVDQALLRTPAWPSPPPPFDESRLTAVNESWNILPEGPPKADTSIKGRLRTFIWRVIGPPLETQLAFNAALVDHLNRTTVTHRETQASLDAALTVMREQTASVIQLQAALMSLLQSVTLYVDTKDRSVGGQIAALNGVVSALTDDWMKRWEARQLHDERLRAQQPVFQQAYDELSQKVALAQQTALLLKREVERLITAPPSHVVPAGAPTVTPETLDSFKYVGFEDRFRGSQDVIRARLADYVDLFAGGQRVIDVGCGRGELLDLLRASGVGAHGIDVNASMVELCRERRLSAEVAGAVDFLEQQPDGSLDGIIAIQVVEHLEPAYLTRFIDLACHKLKPGAPMVLETLNPACWVAFFESYIRDVTHRWPLHPDTLQYLVQAGGFSSVEVQYRAPVADADRLAHAPLPASTSDHPADPLLLAVIDVVNAQADKLNARLFTYMDYAIVARR